MDRYYPSGLDLGQIDTPAFVVDQAVLERNARIMYQVGVESGANMLLALKGYALFASFDLLRPYVDGVCASSINEARLGREEMGLEVHSYSPAYSRESLAGLIELSDHVIFNSPAQWQRFADLRDSSEKVSFGLRYNPNHSETDVALYDPSAPLSRLGTVKDQLPPNFIKQIDGLHIHNLCEKDAPALQRTWQAVEKQLGSQLEHLRWINLGGGHQITRDGYQQEVLIQLVQTIRERYGCNVYLEPGEAWALESGYLVASVLDLHHNQAQLAILDTSASCHMPDVLEMPYRPDVLGSAEAGVKEWSYRLGGVSCLAGDVVGDYSFDRPLQIGDRLVFTDMAHYSMVKTTTFNGVSLPTIYLADSRTGELRCVRRFGYQDFKGRLS